MKRTVPFLVAALLTTPLHAGEAADSIRAFMAHCFTKGITLEQAEKRMRGTTNTPGEAPLPFTLSFYDSTIAPAPEAKPGTDRRCEITFSGDHGAAAVTALRAQMAKPPVFGTAGTLPDNYAATPGTVLIEGRDLPAGRRAVVHVSVQGDLTTIGVDRLAPGEG